MKKKKVFSAFGTEYRTEQFSAVEGLALLAKERALHPCEVLSKTDVLVRGKWVRLDAAENINNFVLDKVDVLVPRVVLDGLMSLVHDFSLGFASGWKSAKIPLRFLSGSKAVASANVDPLINQLIQDGVASLKELETYYSLEDAFKMFDAMVVKGINEALASEAAAKKSTKK